MVGLDGLSQTASYAGNATHAAATATKQFVVSLPNPGFGQVSLAKVGPKDGGEPSIATGPEGSWALGWRITWDTPADATEFEAAYAGAEAGLPFESRVVHGSDTETIVLQASSADVLSRMATLAGS